MKADEKVKILCGILGVLVVILLITIIITNININNEEKATSEEQKSETDFNDETTGIIEDDTDLVYYFTEMDRDSEVYALISDYLNYTYVEFDEEKLYQLCDDASLISGTFYDVYNQNVESIVDLVCYSVNYVTQEGIQVVYVTYSMKFVGIETKMPGMEPILLNVSGDDCRIHILGNGENMNSYLNDVKESSDYRDMVSYVNQQLEAALNENSSLSDIYNSFVSIE